MRVAHFIHRYPPAVGGSEAYFARLSRYLVEQGDAVTVHTTTALDLEAFWDRHGRQTAAGCEVIEGVTVVRHRLWHLPLAHRYVFKALSLVPVPRWQAVTVPFNPYAPGLWNAGRDTPVDLVHASAFPYSFPLVCSRRLARRQGCRSCSRSSTPAIPMTPPTASAALHHAGAATAGAVRRPAVRADRGRTLGVLERGVPAERLVLQGLGVDLPSCTGGDRARARQGWNVPPDAVVIGHLANNSVEKGSVDLLQAAARAWETGARWTMVLAGPEMPNFRAFWERFEPRGRVVRCGVLTEEQKRDFFAGIDLFALPSRSDSFGLVLPEAWANGVPCVGYRAGGVAWVIRDGVDGMLVRCGDVAALSDALTRLAADADLRRRLGEAGRARVDRDFAWPDRLAVVRDVCRTLVGEWRKRNTPER
ncbi:MAG: glycosyltransferase family 4 protein [Gemmataceae bacterium]